MSGENESGLREVMNKPTQVIGIFDNPKYCDRYTIVYDDLGYLGASEDPTHPQGFGQHGEFNSQAQYRGFKRASKAITWDDLPDKVKKVVIRDCTEY